MKNLMNASRSGRAYTVFFCAAMMLLAVSVAAAQTQPLHLNKVIAKLEQGKTITGIWGLSQNMATARSIVEYNGFPNAEEAMTKPMIDFVMVCMEHYPYEIADLREFIQGMVSRRETLAKGNLQPNAPVFVRIPTEGADPVHPMIKQVLDIGAYGVVIPHVRTPEEALKVVKSCRYARPVNASNREPAGIRGFSPAICSYIWGLSLNEYYDRADVWPLNPDGDILVIIMIEDTEGVKNIDRILKVPGIGAVFFGPSDYTVSVGRWGDQSFNVNEALNRVKKACDDAGVPFVGFADITDIDVKAKEKNRLWIVGSDIDKSGMSDRVIRRLRGEK